MDRFMTSRVRWGIYGLTAFVLLCIETTGLSPDDNWLRGAAAWTWLAVSCFLLIVALVYSLLPLRQLQFWSQPDYPWYLIAFFLPPLLLFFDINGATFTIINTESTQQMGSALFLMHVRHDLGIFNLAFLGGTYPARQYILAALPSYIFGQGLVTLRLGYAALYLIGYLSFLSATLAYLKHIKAPQPLLMASFAAMLVSLANYPFLFARIFEQTIIPISATFLFLAGLLFFLIRPSPLMAFWVMWAVGFLPYCYSPALSSWLLAMVLLGYLCFPWLQSRTLPFLIALIYGVVTLFISVVMQSYNHVFVRKLTLGESTELNLNDWLYRYASGLHSTIGLEESLIPAPLMLGSLIILYVTLRQRDFRFLLLCLWAAATVAMALTVKGWCWRPPEFDIHRAMVILPPLSLAFILYLTKYWPQFIAAGNERLMRALIIGCMVLLILNVFYLPFIRRGPRSFYPDLMTDTEEATLLVLHKDPTPKRLYIIPPLACNMEDSLQYFSPTTEIRYANPPAGEHLPSTYLISFITLDPDKHAWDQFLRHLNPRPFLQIKPE